MLQVHFTSHFRRVLKQARQTCPVPCCEGGQRWRDHADLCRAVTSWKFHNRHSSRSPPRSPLLVAGVEVVHRDCRVSRRRSDARVLVVQHARLLRIPSSCWIFVWAVGLAPDCDLLDFLQRCQDAPGSGCHRCVHPVVSGCRPRRVEGREHGATSSWWSWSGWEQSESAWYACAARFMRCFQSSHHDGKLVQTLQNRVLGDKVQHTVGSHSYRDSSTFNRIRGTGYVLAATPAVGSLSLACRIHYLLNEFSTVTKVPKNISKKKKNHSWSKSPEDEALQILGSYPNLFSLQKIIMVKTAKVEQPSVDVALSMHPQHIDIGTVIVSSNVDFMKGIMMKEIFQVGLLYAALSHI